MSANRLLVAHHPGSVSSASRAVRHIVSTVFNLARLTVTVVLAAVVLAAAAGFGAAYGADEDTYLPFDVHDEATEIGGVTPAGFPAYVNVLANDRDPDGGTLRLCGLTNPHEEQVLVHRSVKYNNLPGLLTLDAVVNETATYEVTYVACNDTYRGEGTLTISVFRIDPVEVRTLSPGRVEFTNPGTRSVNISYGRGPARRPDGRFDLAGGASKVVRAHRATIKWNAFHYSYPAGAGRIEDTGAPDHGAVPRVRAKVVAPHQVRFTNPSEFRVELIYGKAGAYGGFGGHDPDDVRTLAPGASITVQTRRDRLRYRCTASYGLGLGHGVMEHIRGPRASLQR